MSLLGQYYTTLHYECIKLCAIIYHILYTGIVNGENEVEPVNNEGPKRPATEDEDVKALIGAGNMEQLAALVLNGHGDKLVGESSDNPELQAFLDNVPVYMVTLSSSINKEDVLDNLNCSPKSTKFTKQLEKEF